MVQGEQAGQLTPWGPVRVEASPEGTPGRILDAAERLFASQGIRATTMAQLAREADISRVWLYRYFDNRDAVVQALLGREAHDFLADLLALVDPVPPVAETATRMFVHAVTTLRSHELLRKIITEEPEIIGQYVVSGIGPLMRVAIDGAAALLATVDTAADPDAVAETLVRLVVFAVLNNDTGVDLDDPDALERYARTIVTALVRPGGDP